MDENAGGRISFTYQGRLSRGSSDLVAPGLISIPSLETTLKMHREYQSRVGEDERQAYEDAENVDVVVNWVDSYEEMSRDVLVAQAICAEIGKGLDLLGITWRTERAGTSASAEANDDRLAELALDAFATQRVEQGIELARFFAGVGSNWTFDSHHVFGGSYLDKDETIFNVTLDEIHETGPQLPEVEGLRDWYDVSEGMELDGFDFDGTALIEDCTAVLEAIVDLILVHKAS